jgi:hypothetical protein
LPDVSPSADRVAEGHFDRILWTLVTTRATADTTPTRQLEARDTQGSDGRVGQLFTFNLQASTWTNLNAKIAGDTSMPATRIEAEAWKARSGSSHIAWRNLETSNVILRFAGATGPRSPERANQTWHRERNGEKASARALHDDHLGRHWIRIEELW